jgi:sec-independent protein translocase protein TatA
MFRNPLTDALVILVVLLLFFGPKRLPMLSRSIGESIKEFRGGLDKRSSDDEEEKPQLSAQSQSAQPEKTETPAQASAERQS